MLLGIVPGPGGELHAHWKVPASVKEWRVLKTARFTIHYPEGYSELGVQAGLYAEESAARYERLLEHRLSRVVPVFLYASHQDFSATNILPLNIGEGTGGFTDFFRRRVVVPFNGDYAALRHVLAHEIAHAFQFDILGDDNYGRYPLWLMEGMAEYLSLGWDQSAENFTRDLVLHGRMPGLADLHGRRVRGYAYYKAGQAVMLYMAKLRGARRIGHFLKEYHQLRRLRPALQSSFEMTPEEFDIGFGKFLRARYAASLARRSGPDPRFRAVTNRYQNRIGTNLNPVLSPDGKRVAYLTVDGIFPAVVIRPAPGPTVTRKRLADIKIVLRALRDSDYEEWQPLTTRLSFTPDGKKIIVAGRRSSRQALLVIDVERRRVVRDFSPPFDAIQYPALEPNGRRVLFTGVLRGVADLYSIHLVTGRLERYTFDYCYETTARFAPAGDAIYFAANCSGSGEPPAAAGRALYRLDLNASGTPRGSPRRLTDLGGLSADPLPGPDGSLIFRSEYTGVSNLYRLRRAATRKRPATADDLEAVTASATGIFQPSRGAGARSDALAFTELEEGALEVRVMPGDIPLADQQAGDGEPASAELLSPGWPGAAGPAFAYRPSEYRQPTDGEPLWSPFQTRQFEGDYSPGFTAEGRPFIIATAGTNSRGQTGLALLAFGSFADDTGDHRLQGFVSALGDPPEFDADMRYIFTRYRTDFFAGAYHQSGVFAVFNPLDFSLNNVLYNPYFRLLSQRSTALYGGAEYAINKYSAVQAVFEQGREERVFRPALPEERPQEDLYQNYQALSLSYRFDNAVYSIFGPLDGHSFMASYSAPLKSTGTERELHVFATEYRYYYLFNNFSTFALRAFAGSATGADAEDYPFRLGGYYTLRGYQFLEFEGKHAFLVNLEYRFNFIDYLQFGFPFRWTLGTVRGVLFADAGSAFDYPDQYQAVDPATGRTRDLHLSYGFGLHWLNFLWPILPGAIMKVEWATPYDGKQSLPVNKWRGQFSLGFNF